MQAVGTSRVMVLLALVLGTLLLIVMAPAAAQAAWKTADAHIADPNGTGYVSLLNVSVVNRAFNDSSAVTEVQLSDDGLDWYPMVYTGAPQDWVLSGESGAKTLYVRFAAADGTLSSVLETHINVDTRGPITHALDAVRGVQGGKTTFHYAVSDPGSPKVKASLLIKGQGVRQTVSLGWVRTGVRSAVVALRLPAGRYRWAVRAVDLAQWAQQREVSKTMVVHR